MTNCNMKQVVTIIKKKGNVKRHKCKRGYNGTGTTRSNRWGRKFPLPSIAAMDKKERGSSSSTSGKVDVNEVKVTRWKDNAVVTVASTLYSQNPSGKVKWWSEKKIKSTNWSIVFMLFKPIIVICEVQIGWTRISVLIALASLAKSGGWVYLHGCWMQLFIMLSK